MNKKTTLSFLIVSLIMLNTTVILAFSPALSPIPGLNDTLYFELEDCSDQVELCVDISGSDLVDYQITDNGLPYTLGFQDCNFDTLNSYSYAPLPGSGSIGPYVLQAWGIGGSSFSAPFNTMSDLVDSMNAWDPAANWLLDAANLLIIGGHPATTYSDMQIWHPSNPTPTMLLRVDNLVARGSLLQLVYGSHQLIFQNTTSGLSDTSLIYVSCTTSENILLEVLVNESDTFCLDFGEFLFPLQSVTNICPDPSGKVDVSFIQGDSCLIFTGLGAGVGQACILACDEMGICDTTFISVTSEFDYQVGIHHIFDTLTLGQTRQYCIDPGVFGGSLAATISNFCPGSSGDQVAVAIDSATYCMELMAIESPGSEEVCIEVCDTAGVCDTTYFHLYVKAPGLIIIRDTILLYDSKIHCDLNRANLQTAPFSMINACPGGALEKVDFEIDEIGGCVNYAGLEVGFGSACVYIEDSLGNVDTTLLEIWVKVPSPEIQNISLTLGDSLTICIDTLELVGRLESIINDCSGSGKVDFFLDEDALCLDLVALEEGQDSACYIFCDQYNLCDTIIWRVEVLPKVYEKPFPADDFAQIIAGQNLEIAICSNDTLPDDQWTSLELLSSPIYGTAFLDTDNCRLEYQSDQANCGITEELLYLVCNGTACDSASVFIDILCEAPPLTFYSGFSPNGDDKNEFFQIDGIEAYPNNRLLIFNRWGLKVFETTAYQNDWTGTWEQQALTEGVYFYIFDNGEGERFTGSLVINR